MNWKKELEQNILTRWGSSMTPGNHEFDELVDFILSLLIQQDKEWKKRVKGLKTDVKKITSKYDTTAVASPEIIHKINTLLGKE